MYRSMIHLISCGLAIGVACAAGAEETRLGPRKTSSAGRLLDRARGRAAAGRAADRRRRSMTKAGCMWPSRPGSNDPVEKQLELRPHRIVRLEDTDGDGKFDRRTVFADRMMFPEGTMFLDGSLYVSAPPSIWKLTDKDGDGVADERVEWFQGKTLTGCANDLHGPYLGPDGWIYWCKGAFAEQTHIGQRPRMEDAGGAHLSLPAGRHRLRAGDDRRHGQSGRCGVHARRRADSFGDVSCRRSRARDGLAHAIYGGVYGKDHGVLDGHPRTGDLMPMLVLDEPGGAVRLGAVRFDGVRRRISRQLCFSASSICAKCRDTCCGPRAATFVSEDSDFVTSRSCRLSSDRRAGGCRRQPAGDRYRRLVQAVLPDVATVEARRAGRHLSRAADRRATRRRPARTADRVVELERRSVLVAAG